MNISRKKRSRLKILPLMLIMTLLMLFTGCQKKPAAPQQPEAQTSASAGTTEQAVEQATEAASLISLPIEEPEKTSSTIELPPQESPSISEDGTYTTKEDVALYIHTYGKLPQNFITKKAAKKLGWEGGSLEDYAPGKCIGGDYFGNYEGLLPEDKEYHECDIDTLGKSKRGAKRIIYSDDGYIYYTKDHYESFELLYEP